ncbi:MAG: 1,4-butanediol diacrylate esterase [Proteobacteria bacterium SG_bin9]|nr:MAG: 1,4-butanediol diacrylate esterase [Proteobacteria bacterium SG_bin9]
MSAQRSVDSSLDAVLSQACEERLAGVVAIAATGSEVVYQGSAGKRDLGKDAAMSLDSVFWIASMTKAVTGAAAMQLVEQGKLSLDDPIDKILPDLAKPQVLDGFDADGEPKLRPATRPITLRQLLTHTSGFCYDMWNADIGRYREKAGLPALGGALYAALRTPLVTDPGTRWEYSTSIDWAGFAVEQASGQRLDTYLHEHIFEPLGMTDTGFRIRDDQRNRLVRVHRRGDDGALTPIDFETQQAPECFMGGGGLYGTASDYIRFTQMILNKGRANGEQVLKPETVALMAQNHIGDLVTSKMSTYAPLLSNDFDPYPQMAKKWGLSFLINTETTPEGRSAGSLAWAGLANTYYWIDPARDMSGVIMMQVLPFADRACLDTYAAFERGVYDMIGATKAA